jgi:hypothetical protein
MMTTESTSQNFLLLLKKKNRRIQGNTCTFRMNRRMWRVAVLHVQAHMRFLLFGNEKKPYNEIPSRFIYAQSLLLAPQLGL